MKRKNRHVKFTIMCMLVLSQIFLLAGCTNQDTESAQNCIRVDANGQITDTIVEAFDKDYYTQESLQEMIEKEIKEYTGQDGAVKLNSLAVSEDMDRNVTVVMTYTTWKDYAEFNDTRLFYGTVSEAQTAGYAIPSDLVSAKDESRTMTLQELDSMKDYHILITEESVPVYLPEKPVYFTKGTSQINSKCIKAGEESTGLTFVIMK